MRRIVTLLKCTDAMQIVSVCLICMFSSYRSSSSVMYKHGLGKEERDNSRHDTTTEANTLIWIAVAVRVLHAQQQPEYLACHVDRSIGSPVGVYSIWCLKPIKRSRMEKGRNNYIFCFGLTNRFKVLCCGVTVAINSWMIGKCFSWNRSSNPYMWIWVRWLGNARYSRISDANQVLTHKPICFGVFCTHKTNASASDCVIGRRHTIKGTV